MPNQPPFRMPCEGVAGKPLYYFGNPYQHALASVLVHKYANTTLVPNPAGGADIAPFERYADLSGTSGCETNHCGAGPCSAWKAPFTANVFTDTGDFVDMAVTRKRGFKNVMARRFWNGRLGYLDKSAGGIDTVQPCSDPSTMKSWLSPQATFYRTRYGTLVASATYSKLEYVGGSISTNINQSADLTEVIDPSTGILSATALTVTPNIETSLALAAISAWAFSKYSQITSHFVGTTASVDTIVWTAGNVTASDSGTGFTREVVSWDFAAGTFSRDIYDWDPLAFGITRVVVFHEEATLTDTTIEYSSHDIRFVPDYVNHIHGHEDISVTGTLSVQITDATIYADIKTLLDEWNLANDKQYPWRTDLKAGVAPLVSRNELPNQEFQGTGYFVKDYNVPIVDSNGFTIGDPGWDGTTGVILAPSADTGTYRTAFQLGPYATGNVIDIQMTGFAHTDAAITCTKIGGNFPSGVSMTSAGHVTGTVGDDGKWGVTIDVTCGVAACNGEMLGAPNSPGQIDFFDFRFQNWAGCCFRPGDGSQNWAWYLQGWGTSVIAFNNATGCHLPLNATQWTNWFQSVNKPIGAFLFYNDLRNDYFGSGCHSTADGAISGSMDGGALWGCKYAEILEQWPSQNFAMPAGDAKFWFDESFVHCATHISGSGAGSTWNLIDQRTGSPPTTFDTTKIWGGPVVGGFYNITSYSAGVVTLGSKAFDLPSNWLSKSRTQVAVSGHFDDDFCFGMLRWPSSPSLLGRIAVTTTGPGTTFTYASQASFGMDSSTHQEQVDLYDATMTAVATNVTATRISDTQFSTVASYATVAWVQIHGAAKHYVNDTDSKGDFTVLDWLADLRSIGEWNRLGGKVDCSGTQVTRPTANVGGGPVDAAFASFHQTQCCLPFQPCAPKVVCISPNGETFANGITYDFPSDFACDGLYGSKWWKVPQQTMTDVLWQQPHRPCNIETCSKWTMDNGLCLDDVPGTCPSTDEAPAPQYYFGLAPQVEARLTVPSSTDSCSAAYGADGTEAGAELPSVIQIGWLSPVDYTAGEVALPPEPPGVSDPGTPNGTSTPWYVHAIICDHSAGCRFGYSLPGC